MMNRVGVSFLVVVILDVDKEFGIKLMPEQEQINQLSVCLLGVLLSFYSLQSIHSVFDQRQEE